MRIGTLKFNGSDTFFAIGTEDPARVSVDHGVSLIREAREKDFVQIIIEYSDEEHRESFKLPKVRADLQAVMNSLAIKGVEEFEVSEPVKNDVVDASIIVIIAKKKEVKK